MLGDSNRTEEQASVLRKKCEVSTCLMITIELSRLLSIGCNVRFPPAQ